MAGKMPPRCVTRRTGRRRKGLLQVLLFLLIDILFCTTTTMALFGFGVPSIQRRQPSPSSVPPVSSFDLHSNDDDVRQVFSSSSLSKQSWRGLSIVLSVQNGGGNDSDERSVVEKREEEADDSSTTADAEATTTLRPIAMEYDHDDNTEDDATPQKQRVLLLMDSFCPYHGGYLAQRAREMYHDVAIVYVLSDYLYGYLSSMMGDDNDDQQEQQLAALLRPRDPASADAFCAAIRHQLLGNTNTESDIDLVAVYCESDSGLADAEQVRQLLDVTCVDDPVVQAARRDKSDQQRVVAAGGTLVVADQQLCYSCNEAVVWAKERLLERSNDDNSSSTSVVVKPIRGVASESVYRCHTIKQVTEAWENICATQIFGSTSGKPHTTVLVQEFLEGTEYAVDVVSRQGAHKVAAIWRYVKRPANGASFCYLKTELVDMESEDTDGGSIVSEICDYVTKSLDALGVKWGLSHNEIIVDPTRGPMLVEVNCRQHNMDFCPLTMAAIGYNALDMTIVALLGTDDDWDAYPDRPVLRAHSCMVHLLSFAQGHLMATRHLADLAALDSVLECEVYERFRTPGSYIEPTVDIRTDAGWAMLIGLDPGALEKDYQQIVAWMPSMFLCDNAEKEEY